MIRTVWLGLSFLVILAAVGSFRFAFGHFDVANASGIVRSEDERIAYTKAVQETLTKADQLPVAYVFPEAELAKVHLTPVELPSQVPAPIVTSRVASRHWHDPAAPGVQRPRDQKSKHKRAKGNAIADKSEADAEPRACQLADFDALRAAFNLPTGCRT